MRHWIYYLVSFFILNVVSSQGYSEMTDPLLKLSTSMYQMYSIPAAQNPKAASLLANILKKNDYVSKSLNELRSQIDEANNTKLAVMNELRASIPHLKYSDSEQNQRLNFVELQIDDAITLLEGVKLSPILTLNLLSKMRELAVQAANAAQTTKLRERLNYEFQAYLMTIPHAQMIGLVDGVKQVSGGSLKIMFGKGSNQTSAIKIHLPAIDIKSLRLENLRVNTVSEAQEAVKVIDQAIQPLIRYQAIASESVINEIEVMIYNMPVMLSQNLDLVITARDVILQAINGSMSDNDREILNIELDNLKAAMSKTQTFISLSGPILTGGGKITLQVADKLSAETKLDINLPVTDIKVLGLDKINITSRSAANEALLTITDFMRNFVYYPSAGSDFSK